MLPPVKTEIGRCGVAIRAAEAVITMALIISVTPQIFKRAAIQLHKDGRRAEGPIT
jgi:hypothetical protein